MPTQKLTPEIINAAIQGFEFQKTSIDGKIAELRAMLTGGPAEPAATPEALTRKRKKFSAAAQETLGGGADPSPHSAGASPGHPYPVSRRPLRKERN